jgi:hypothetical protein
MNDSLGAEPAGITYDPATVTAATLGINNAVAHQSLLLI